MRNSFGGANQSPKRKRGVFVGSLFARCLRAQTVCVVTHSLTLGALIRCPRSDDVTIHTASYDGRGRRLKKVVTNAGQYDGTVVFYYDDWKIIETGRLEIGDSHLLTTDNNPCESAGDGGLARGQRRQRDVTIHELYLEEERPPGPESIRQRLA